ncbi:MAG TPA: glycosyltransferase family 2 protein [Ignavibacteria bacterium]
MISIIMPVYNIEKYIKESVMSVLNQTYDNFELLIIDDGSMDNTVGIIESFKDNRIQIHKRRHEGFVNQLNYGLEIAKGDLIARMDGDDTMDTHRLQYQYDFLMRNKDIHLVGTNFNYINEEGKLIVEKQLPEYNNDIEFMMPVLPSVIHGTILTYKDVLISAVGFPKDYSCEDVVLFMKLFSLGYKMYNIQLQLYNYRQINKSDAHYKEHYKDYYKYSTIYLSKIYEDKIIPSWNYYFRKGLLEYYMGKLSESRKYFYKCFKYNQIKKVKLLRYLMISLLGQKLLNFLRKKRITEKANLYIQKIFKFDTNVIKLDK